MTDIINIRILSLSVISFSSPIFSGYKTLSPSQYSHSSSHLTLVLYRYHFHRFIKVTVSLSSFSFSAKSVRLWLYILPWPCIHHSSQYLRPQFCLLNLLSHHLFNGTSTPTSSFLFQAFAVNREIMSIIYAILDFDSQSQASQFLFS